MTRPWQCFFVNPRVRHGLCSYFSASHRQLTDFFCFVIFKGRVMFHIAVSRFVGWANGLWTRNGRILVTFSSCRPPFSSLAVVCYSNTYETHGGQKGAESGETALPETDTLRQLSKKAKNVHLKFLRANI